MFRPQLVAARWDKIKEIIARKRAMAKYYLKNLKDIKEIQLPVEEPYAFNVYWMFNIILKGKLSGKRSFFMAELKKRGVEAREDFVPFNQQKIFIKQRIYKNRTIARWPIIFLKTVLYLPSGTGYFRRRIKICSQAN